MMGWDGNGAWAGRWAWGFGSGVRIIILGGVNDDAAFGLHRTT